MIGTACRVRMKRHGPALMRYGKPVGLSCLVGVGWPYDHQARHRAQRSQLFDRLMGGAVLTEADRVVRPYMKYGNIHQRGEADRSTRVVGEDQVAGIVCPQARQHHPIDHGAHPMLADAVVQIVAAVVAQIAIRLKLSGIVDNRE